MLSSPRYLYPIATCWNGNRVLAETKKVVKLCKHIWENKKNFALLYLLLLLEAQYISIEYLAS